jgi:16S rRNA G966 N2-methylase RsmD
MRITTGQYKGRLIKMPKGIRPTQDKVRKAIFDILGDIEGLSFLELFAGTGAVGIEAVSRGVKELTLVEYNRDCLLAIKKNIESLKVKNCRLYPKEAEAAIQALHKDKKVFDLIFFDPPYHNSLATPSPRGGAGVPLSAATPNPKGWIMHSGIKDCRVSRFLRDVPPSAATPNPKGWIGMPLSAAKKTLQTLCDYDILAPNGFIVVQHFKKDDLPETLGVFSLFKRKTYGDTVVSLYRKKD